MKRSTILKAWSAYILVYVLVALPVRAIAWWFAGGFADEVRATGEVELRALLLAGVILLPVSFLCFRWAVQRFLAAAVDGEGPA